MCAKPVLGYGWGGMAPDCAQDAGDGQVGVHAFTGAAGRHGYRGVGDGVGIDSGKVVAAAHWGAVGSGPFELAEADSLEMEQAAMHQPVVAATEQHEVVDVGESLVGPPAHMMGVQETCGVTAGRLAAVPGSDGQSSA